MGKARTQNDSLYDTAHGELAAAMQALRNASRMVRIMKDAPERLGRFSINEAMAQVELLSNLLDVSQQEEYANANQGKV